MVGQEEGGDGDEESLVAYVRFLDIQHRSCHADCEKRESCGGFFGIFEAFEGCGYCAECCAAQCEA